MSVKPALDSLIQLSVPDVSSGMSTLSDSSINRAPNYSTERLYETTLFLLHSVNQNHSGLFTIRSLGGNYLT